jgi:hypothetical protein
MPPWAIVAKVPLKDVRQRFTAELLYSILWQHSKWIKLVLDSCIKANIAPGLQQKAGDERMENCGK